jgi:hypothetical protein
MILYPQEIFSGGGFVAYAVVWGLLLLTAGGLWLYDRPRIKKSRPGCTPDRPQGKVGNAPAAALSHDHRVAAIRRRCVLRRSW